MDRKHKERLAACYYECSQHTPDWQTCARRDPLGYLQALENVAEFQEMHDEAIASPASGVQFAKRAVVDAMAEETIDAIECVSLMVRALDARWDPLFDLADKIEAETTPAIQDAAQRRADAEAEEVMETVIDSEPLQ